MDIGIIGYGVIGKSIADTFTSGTVYVNDIRAITEINNIIVKDSLELLANSGAELIFICVPSPTVNGTFDSSYIIGVLDELESIDTPCPPIVLKSTIPPDIASNLFNRYKKLLTVYNPEFLRQNQAKDDLLDIEKHYVYSTTTEGYETFNRYINASDCNKDVIRFESLEKLTLLKYAANSYNATRVIFANCIYQIFNQLDSKDSDMSFSEFIDIFGDFLELNKKRWGHNLRVPGPDGKKGYGGACLPKDVQALVEYSSKHKCEEAYDLFNTIEQINSKVR